MTKPKCKCCADSPFHWQKIDRASIFLKDPYYRAAGVHSRKQSEVVERERLGGRDIGYIPGLTQQLALQINPKQFHVYARA
jgi:hypothetical protein